MFFLAYKKTVDQLFLYGLLGLCGTACHYSVLIVLVEFFNLGSVAGSSAGFVLGAFVNHSLNRHILFRMTKKNYFQTVTKFLLVASIGFGLNFILMLVFVIVFKLYYLVGQIMSTLIVFVFTFFINKLWTFQVE